jgi:hypothetical protein
MVAFEQDGVRRFHLAVQGQEIMTNQHILFPACAMALLTAIVWVRLYVTRIREIRTRRIRVNEFRTRATSAPLLAEVSSASDNFMNLFELPVLFYVLLTMLYVTALADGFYLALAWGFVALRVVHSAIHVTYNKVTHRFFAYVAGSTVLWLMWLRFAWQLMGR